MDKLKPFQMNDSALDEDVIMMLSEAQQPAAVAADSVARMRANVMQTIKQEHACQHEGFSTVRAADGEWLEVSPGAQVKILNDDGYGIDGFLSYLVKLEPGFQMEGHDHPFDEECLMLEGDLTLGNLTLNQGDFHVANMGVSHGHVSTQGGCMAFIRGAFPA